MSLNTILGLLAIGGTISGWIFVIAKFKYMTENHIDTHTKAIEKIENRMNEKSKILDEVVGSLRELIAKCELRHKNNGR